MDPVTGKFVLPYGVFEGMRGVFFWLVVFMYVVMGEKKEEGKGKGGNRLYFGLYFNFVFI